MPPRKSPVDPKSIELAEAAFVCDFLRVRELLAAGAHPDARDADGRTTIFSAVLGNSVGVLGLLLEAGADVNARDGHGWTALHFAASEHLPEVTQILLGSSADVNVQDEDGATPLWRAVQGAHGRSEIIELLRAKGAKDDIPNNRGETPRELAERLGDPFFTAN
jgi:ankyrin repeat protein